MKGLTDLNAPWIPSPSDEMLLMAALAPAGKAHDAGLAWLTSANLAAQVEATIRLLPLVHDRLVRDGIDHPAMAILKGVRRKVWSRNQLMFKRVTPAIVALRHAGIDVMLLKGAALTLSYYQDYGLRPMGDIDVMVRVSDVSAAIEILTESGWKSSSPMKGKLGQTILKYSQEEHFKDSSGLILDFHWHLSPLCVNPSADYIFWNDSTTVKFESVDVRLLNSADQLLHACLHGLTWSKIPSIRWVSDSMEIIRKDTDLDWNRLLLQTRQRKVVLFVRSALNYLVERFDAPVPCNVMEAIKALPVNSYDTREFIVLTEWRPFYSTKLGNHFSTPKTLQVLYFIYRRIVTDSELNRNNLSIIDYMCSYYRKENIWRLLSYLIYRIGKRTSRAMLRLVSRTV